MKKRIIYLLMAVIGTVGFTGCGPGQNTGTDQNRTGTGTTTGTTVDGTGTTTGNRTSTTTRTTTGDRTGTATTNQDRLGNTSGQERFRLSEATDFSYENENLRFNPDQRGITITRNQNGQQTPYGTMRSFGNEGYYIVTTTSPTGEEETSFGRFDQNGNFMMYSYDSDSDNISERSYRTTRPATTTGTGTNNNNRPMNNN